MALLLKWIISTVAVMIASYLLPGVHVVNFQTAFLVALTMGIMNVLVKPLLVILTLPITIVTLGLFIFVINALVVMVVSQLIPGFRVDGFFWALLFSIVVSVANSFLSKFL